MIPRSTKPELEPGCLCRCPEGTHKIVFPSTEDGAGVGSPGQQPASACQHRPENIASTNGWHHWCGNCGAIREHPEKPWLLPQMLAVQQPHEWMAELIKDGHGYIDDDRPNRERWRSVLERARSYLYHAGFDEKGILADIDALLAEQPVEQPEPDCQHPPGSHWAIGLGFLWCGECGELMTGLDDKGVQTWTVPKRQQQGAEMEAQP